MKNLKQSLIVGDGKMRQATAGDMIQLIYVLIEYGLSVITLFPAEVAIEGLATMAIAASGFLSVIYLNHNNAHVYRHERCYLLCPAEDSF